MKMKVHIDRRTIEMSELETENNALRVELRAAVDALRLVQWGSRLTAWLHLCPLCDQSRSRGHTPDCHVGTAIENYDAAHPEVKDNK